jgi:hypothetical protein
MKQYEETAAFRVPEHSRWSEKGEGVILLSAQMFFYYLKIYLKYFK